LKLNFSQMEAAVEAVTGDQFIVSNNQQMTACNNCLKRCAQIETTSAFRRSKILFHQ